MQRGLLYLVCLSMGVCGSVCLLLLIYHPRLQGGTRAIPTASVLCTLCFKWGVFIAKIKHFLLTAEKLAIFVCKCTIVHMRILPLCMYVQCIYSCVYRAVREQERGYISCIKHRGFRTLVLSFHCAKINTYSIGKHSIKFCCIALGVHLSLNGKFIPNHGYVKISDIGSNDNMALLCHTNRPPPPGMMNSGGEWFAPDGTRVTDTAVPGFRRNRGPMVVRLLRAMGSMPTPEGIYNCQLMDIAGEEQTVHVGLYSEGGDDSVHK